MSINRWGTFAVLLMANIMGGCRDNPVAPEGSDSINVPSLANLSRSPSSRAVCALEASDRRASLLLGLSSERFTQRTELLLGVIDGKECASQLDGQQARIELLSLIDSAMDENASSLSIIADLESLRLTVQSR